MPKVGVEPRRRADVINATLTCISKFGIDGMTLDKVAEQAGCSKGVVTYYYKNKDELTIEAFKSFMAFYGAKIEAEISDGMSAAEMLEIALKHMLPSSGDDAGANINVSLLDGIDNMRMPYEDQGRLFVHFFSRTAVDAGLREVVSVSYERDLAGLARIFELGGRTGEMAAPDPYSAAYGLMAMVVGLGFFRVANVAPVSSEDNRYIGEAYAKRFMKPQ